MRNFIEKIPFCDQLLKKIERRRKQHKNEVDLKTLSLQDEAWKLEKKTCLFKKKANVHSDFFRQPLVFYNIFERFNLFDYYCRDKKVLHVGCTDYPVFNPESNLHILLSKLAKEIHGLDVDKEGIQKLKQYVDQPYYSFVSELEGEYDVCLIPEVIEHVNDLSLFLQDISKINANVFIITGPNAFSKAHIDRNYLKSGELSLEINHADHNCWFSPYTLKNSIEKYSSLKVQKTYLMNNQTMVCCICVK